jgi:hypothetical protein
LSEEDYNGNKKSYPPIFIKCTYSTPPISVYPNPASNIIHIDANLSNILEVKIFGDDGKLIYLGKDNVINIENYVSGMYLVKVVTEDGVVFSKKIIKE